MLIEKRKISAVLAISLLAALTVFGQVDKVIGNAEELKITADSVQHDQDTGLAKASGNVKIMFGKLTLTAKEASVNQENSDFTANGNVVISLADGGGEWRAPSVKGNLDTREFSFGPYRLDSPVWHSGGQGGTNDKDGNMKLEGAWLSTCDCPEPHYCLSASSITHNKNKTFTAKNVLLKFGGVPVFYLPILWGNSDGNSGFIIRPGYSGKRGAYLRLGRIWKFGPAADSSLYVDLMSKRGIGLGSDINFKTDSRELGSHLYGILDNDAPETEHGYNRRFKYVDERYRISTYYRDELADGLTLRLNLDLMSDIDMLEDWFRRDYRRIEQPRSYVDLTYDHEYFTIGLGARPRVNDFYTVVETLPEFRFDVPRVNLGPLPFQYQSGTKIGYYSMKWRNFDRERIELLPFDIYDGELHGDASDYQSFRAHSQHFLYLPLELGDSSVFIPRAGVAATYYSRSSKRKVTENDLANMLEVDNPDRPYSTAPVPSYDSDGGDVARIAFEIGAEWKARAYSDWYEFRSERMDFNGIRHVVEPYVNYTFAPDPSHDRDYLYYFDEIDRLDRQHFIRLGLDQRLVTKGEKGNRAFMNLQSYVDFHFDRGEETERHPGDLGNRVEFMPRDDFKVWAALVHDMGDGEIQRGEAGMRLGEEKDLNLRMRYIYRNDHLSRSVWSLGSTLEDFSGESSYLKKRFESADVVVADLFIPINPKTSLGISAEYDFEKNKISEHMYELRRELHCWTMAFGIGWDNEAFQAMLMFQLTAFPKVKLDLNM